ncbi:hypothetical protein EJB05_30742, partial [Eragrostis curvula]
MPQRGAHFSGLPDDLVAGILCLSPPREVARVRLVCKRWRALTTDHHFVRASFSMRQAGHGRHIAGFFFNHRQWSTTEYLALDPEPEAGEEGAAGDRLTPDLSFIPGTFPVDPELGILKVLGSCGGLLLLCCWPSDCPAIHYVCNPLTKKLVEIVLPTDAAFYVSLAFDPSKSQHYKVIALGGMHRIHIYSSETQSWGTPVPFDHSLGLLEGLHSMHGIFWNGSVVWIMTHSLVRFIIKEERVTDMPMPSRKKDRSCAYIGESGGHLQMIGYTKKDKLTACFDVLEMQEISRSGLFCIMLTLIK